MGHFFCLNLPLKQALAVALSEDEKQWLHSLREWFEAQDYDSPLYDLLDSLFALRLQSAYCSDHTYTSDLRQARAQLTSLSAPQAEWLHSDVCLGLQLHEEMTDFAHTLFAPIQAALIDNQIADYQSFIQIMPTLQDNPTVLEWQMRWLGASLEIELSSQLLGLIQQTEAEPQWVEYLSELSEEATQQLMGIAALLGYQSEQG
jgi:hypothetical protein